MAESQLTAAKAKKQLSDGFWAVNPITIHILGICSALAVTTQLKPALVMSGAVTAVLMGSNFIISLMRNAIPAKIRIIVYLTVISTLVILTDQVLKAFMYDVSKQLSIFVGLIITNCIVMGRAEAFAVQNPPLPSIVDGLANGLGYGLALCIVAFFRELLGSGKLFGIQVVPDALYDMGYVNMGLMVIPAGAFIILGFFIWVQKEFQLRKKR